MTDSNTAPSTSLSLSPWQSPLAGLFNRLSGRARSKTTGAFGGKRKHNGVRGYKARADTPHRLKVGRKAELPKGRDEGAAVEQTEGDKAA